MSLNKFMHPRNIYKNPPNFKELAILYPDFRKHAKQDVAGKVSINFQDQEALRALTTALLKKDFGLEVKIPSGRLVPTLPLRLNYLLWIEDLLALCDGNQEKSVCGIDIGTGASCIYPLLAAKKNGWHMIASETDHESANAAKINVENNHLQELIKVQLVGQDKILTPLVEKEEKYDFCMCNPPFFKNEEQLDQKKKSRTAERPPPRNAWTGSIDEVVTPGGEIGLISKIVEESLQLRNSIRIYTTMVGVKSDLQPLKEELLRHGITNAATTEFCQGRTTRWGLAWSFNDQPNLMEACGKHSHKKIKPMSYVVPCTNKPDGYTVDCICEKVKELLGGLQRNQTAIGREREAAAEKGMRWDRSLSHMLFCLYVEVAVKEVKNKYGKFDLQQHYMSYHTKDYGSAKCDGPDRAQEVIKLKRKLSKEDLDDEEKSTEAALRVKCKELKHSLHARVMTVSAAQNTWTHQRRQRRKMQKNLKMDPDGTERESDEIVSPEAETSSEMPLHDTKSTSESNIGGTMKLSDETKEVSLGRVGSYVQSEAKMQFQSKKREVEEHSADLEPSAKKIKTEKLLDDAMEKDKNAVTQSDKNADTSKVSPVLNATLIVRKETDKILIEMTYIDGSSGKDGVHQVLQYIRNNLK
ncbi:RNA N6-adenosine-methyltransferase METTL16-like isoform X1 [Schistocerca gregaria]|uniref:RNA N6-adenosine-methyltransferase METTL16-like isoform X1 n=1 Tax=Schistocerca gregaria TaxID=7010 RepID=UPI00211DBDD9|nr:RNA N6-adenosine-methyltransferase METTL16-like isoform X1 [Schistocerca gregaria]